MIASRDADWLAGRIGDGFEVAVVVELIKVTVGTSGPHSATGCDATDGHFNHVHGIGEATDTDDRPLFTGGVVVFPPQDLGRAVGLGLQRVAAGLGHISESVPGFVDVNLGRNDAVEDDSADFTIADRFDRDADSAGVFIFGWANRLDGRLADEAGQLHRAGFRIRDRRIKADDTANRDDRTGRVVNANGRCVSKMRASTTATRQPTAMHRLRRRQQPIVFDRGDFKVVAGSNTSGQLRDSKSVKIAFGVNLFDVGRRGRL